MPVPLSVPEVERIAALAHLELTEAEKELFGRQLAEILTYVEQLQEVDTTGVPPTSHVLIADPALRSDDVQPSLPRADALMNAPEPSSDGSLFKVPRVIG